MDTIIPPAHQTKYRLNPNYVIVVKQDINKLLAVGFIKSIKKATWLSPIVVVPKEKWQAENLYRFQKLNASTKKDPYPLPFTYEVLNTIVRYEAYSFLNGYSWYHEISIALEDRYKTAFIINWGAFIWKVMPFGVKNGPPTY